MKFKFIIKIILMFILCFIGTNAYADRSYQISTTPRPLTQDEKGMAISATKKYLGDEYKAQFDSLEFIWPDYNGNKYGGYCGLVNIKNSKGQYQGFYPFILFFQKNTQGQNTIYYVATPGEYDIEQESTDSFFRMCKENERFQYDLIPLLQQQEQ